MSRPRGVLINSPGPRLTHSGHFAHPRGDVYKLGVEESPLEKATRHAMNGARILARHRRLIAELRADGHDTTSAEALLATLIATQHIFEDHMRAALKVSGLDKRGSASIMPVSFQPSHDIGEPRSAKMDRFARALSAGWMIRAAEAQRADDVRPL